MKLFFDSSVLVAALVASHPRHAWALQWLVKARSSQHEFLVCSHTLAELYAVLTVLPTSPRLAPSLARQLVQENVIAAARVVTLNAKDYGAVLQGLAELELAGGVTYDALIARAAQKASADHLLTLNRRHFLLVWPEGAGVITSP